MRHVKSSSSDLRSTPGEKRKSTLADTLWRGQQGAVGNVRPTAHFDSVTSYLVESSQVEAFDWRGGSSPIQVMLGTISGKTDYAESDREEERHRMHRAMNGATAWQPPLCWLTTTQTSVRRTHKRSGTLAM